MNDCRVTVLADTHRMHAHGQCGPGRTSADAEQEIGVRPVDECLHTPQHGRARDTAPPQRLIVVDESDLPHETLIVQAIYITVGLSVLAHGLAAAPLADRYARWYERHPRDRRPPMEDAPAVVTRTRGRR